MLRRLGPEDNKPSLDFISGRVPPKVELGLAESRGRGWQVGNSMST